ncbi:pimeloyl-ACP methyl ester carboxylesterase [Rhodanobacter sp. ANJX3]|uniref:alpha/beta fold hydrolase n=1 Tax=unclassified Rhodanobacter TaxID=2621553 RepID=UPI0015C92D2D|nr:MULTISPECIES: alpha/beta hydrolase [unclassified Rhodanobacter]MBB5357480.1 pimeloyl-ACP methyl ester carboxylesterase [Rhodanobacter sp. ANJX3]NYE27529.1 pimeloyl-ACP methyl ester carboxylesterase [Rhodanobacter sp. K2T2]
MMIVSNGIELHVEQRGAGSPAVVFLHYWGGSSRTWQHVVDPLAPDLRTIAIDQRGWGRSAAPASGYALADMANDALAVVEALDLERYILVGHSMGGKVAQLIASRRPRGLVGLALVAPAPPTPLNLPLEIREGMVRAYDSRESIIATLDQVLAPDGLDAEDRETVIADSLAGAAAAKEAWPLASSQEDIATAVAAIDVPVIVISGEHDRVDPPEGLRRELLPRIPQAELYVLPKVGHLSPLEAPDLVADLIRTFALSIVQEGFPSRSQHAQTALLRCPECWAARPATGRN